MECITEFYLTINEHDVLTNSKYMEFAGKKYRCSKILYAYTVVCQLHFSSIFL